MKYTKKQRHEIYKNAYKKINSRTHDYICHAIYCNVSDLPELFNMFPLTWRYCDSVTCARYLGSYCWDWYYRRELRKTILEFCIEMTK